MDAPDRWSSASDLAEYAFCPRAYQYRRSGPAPPSAAAETGTAYHAHRLAAERRRAGGAAGLWVALAAGGALIAMALLLGVT